MGHEFGRVQGWSNDVEGWIRAFAEGLSESYGQVLIAFVSLVVAGIGVLTAEGGRTHRKVKRIKEELEIIELMGKTGVGNKVAMSVHVAEEIRRYMAGLSRGTRRLRLLRRLVLTIAVAAVVYAAYNFSSRVSAEPSFSRFVSGALWFILAVGVLAPILIVNDYMVKRVELRDDRRRESLDPSEGPAPKRGNTGPTRSPSASRPHRPGAEEEDWS